MPDLKTLTAPDQLRSLELLKDPIYRKWFGKKPVLLPHQQSPKLSAAWYLYVQKEEEGGWARGEIRDYAQAYNWVKENIKQVYDFAIVSRRRPYLPPTHYKKFRRGGEVIQKLVYWSNFPRSHDWCPYCRRPTVFTWFSKHHADSEIRRKFLGPATEKRCSICGIRSTAVEPWSRLDRR